MAFGKISGPMLQPDLVRQGVDLSVDTNLVYIDVTNRRLGINTVTPTQSLDVPGNVRLANLSILGNTITSDTGKINLGTIGNIQITGGLPNYVIFTDGAGNLSFGNLDVLSGLEGFTANYVTLGANTVGSFSNAVTISSTTTVTDAIALVNQNVGNVTANVNTLLSKVYANANVAAYMTTYLPTYSGNIAAGNVIGTVYGSIHTDYISGNTGNVVTITGNGAITVPTGTTSNRPVGTLGAIRYNSDLSVNTLEFYNGTNWIPFQNAITDQQITPDGTSTSYALNFPTATAESMLVSINGTVQRPGAGSAYTVSGGYIVFAEAPAITDIVDIRYIASATSAVLSGLTTDIGTSANVIAGNVQTGSITANTASVNTITGNTITGNVVASNTVITTAQISVLYANTAVVTAPNVSVTGNTVVDYFSASTYRSVRYNIQSSYGSSFQSDSVCVIHNGTQAYLTATTTATGANLGVYSTALVAGSNVQLYFTPTNSNTQLRIHKLQFVI